ncbi:MAG TPA: hypothetical protein VIO64_02640 [Pseudobacteroides sp.]|uniref:hypothetical protein n=1 Tax=Pseudobacteroides sp. TaxID=1968840 RepID=UPI002F930BDF
MDFFDYIYNYYIDKLLHYESLEFSQLDKDTLLNTLSEASSLKKFLNDNKEEGYKDTYDAFCIGLDAINRLDTVINRGLTILNGKEENLFYLFPKKVSFHFEKDTCPVKIYELNDYLNILRNISPNDINFDVIKQIASQDWVEKTTLVLNEMHRYAQWIRENNKFNNDLIFLLRDTLLLYLNFKHLENMSQTCVIPVMLNRKFFSNYGDIFYKFITPPIYDIISQNPDISYCDICRMYKQEFNKCESICLQQAKNDAFNYIDSIMEKRKYTIIESGIQGSMPLFIMSIINRVDSFLMYTTAPWLFKQYNGIIFRKNYNYLRDMETLICQNDLFDYHHLEKNKVYIKEYQNEEIKSLAYYEIYLFKQLVTNSNGV